MPEALLASEFRAAQDFSVNGLYGMPIVCSDAIWRVGEQHRFEFSWQRRRPCCAFACFCGQTLRAGLGGFRCHKCSNNCKGFTFTVATWSVTAVISRSAQEYVVLSVSTLREIRHCGFERLQGKYVESDDLGKWTRKAEPTDHPQTPKKICIERYATRFCTGTSTLPCIAVDNNTVQTQRSTQELGKYFVCNSAGHERRRYIVRRKVAAHRVVRKDAARNASKYYDNS